MAVFLIRRVLQALVVLLLVTIITFMLLRLIPGNVAVAIMGPGAYRNPAAIRLFDTTYGFDKPWYSQYLLWLGHLARGNLGYSWNLNQSVASLLASHLPKTVFLVGVSTVLALIVAVPIGVIQAVRRNKLVDHFFNGFSTVCYAMPSFLLGCADPDLRGQVPDLAAAGPSGRGPGRALQPIQRADPAHHLAGPGNGGAVQQVHALRGAG